MISQISSIHLCPTVQSLENLKNEGITKNVFLVGNTIVDSCDYILNHGNTSKALKDIVKLNQNYFICTLHRREK